MSTYENLHGRRVNVVSSNPSNPKEGEVWYNSTLGQLKGYVMGDAAWSSGGNYPTNIFGAAAAGNTPAGLVFGGSTGSGYVTTTSEYDGSSFSSGGALPAQKRYLAGFGTQTAALSVKGKSTPGPAVNTSEEYDGSSWTAGGTASVALQQLAGSGTQTVALSTGGDPPASATNELWNGTSWTEIADLSTARGASGTCNTSATATFVAGGRNASGTKVATTEEFTVDLANKTITAS